MTWQFPHRIKACYALLPDVNHEALCPRLLDACTPFIEPYMAREAGGRGYRLTVCDIKPREHCVDEADICGLPYPKQSFRGVISSDTLEHVEDMDAAARELRRVTEDGGFLILCLPVCFLAAGGKRQTTERAEPNNPMHHLWRPGMDMEQRVCAAGYRTVARLESFDFGKMHLSVVWLMEATG